MKRNKLYTLWIVLLAGMLAFAACSKDPNDGPGTGTDGKVTISMVVAGSIDETGASLATKVVSTVQQSYIDKVTLLLFESDPVTEVETLAKKIAIDDVDNSKNVKTFTIDQEEFELDKKYRIVLLANIEEFGDPGDNIQLNIGETKAAIYEKLDFNLNDYWDDWAQDPATKYIPMWGESEKLLHYTGNRTVFTTVQMLRSVAAIDIIASNYTSKYQFNLQTVLFYNHPAYSKLAPDEGAYNHNTRQVSAVSIPSVSKWNAEYDHVFAAPYGSGGNTYQSFGNVFMPESKKEGGANGPLRLIVGGYYLSTTEMVYHMIDLVNTYGDPVDIIRNKRFYIVIQEVLEKGAANPEDAWKKPLSVVAKILDWDMSLHPQDDLGALLKHKMTIDKAFFHFNHDGRGAEVANRSNAYTDHKINITITDMNDNPLNKSDEDYVPWEVSKVTDLDGTVLTDPWVTITTGFYDFDNSQYAALPWDANQPIISCDANLTEERRSAYVHLKSGTWEFAVQVTQDAIEDCGREESFEQFNYHGKDYDTHIYHDKWTRTVRCWMVDNLRSAGPLNEYLNNTDYLYNNYPIEAPNGESGYYYSTDKIHMGEYDPCPEGWHTSTYEEFANIVSPYLNERLQGQGITDLIPIENFPDEGTVPSADRWFKRSDLDNPGYIESDGSPYGWGTDHVRAYAITEPLYINIYGRAYIGAGIYNRGGGGFAFYGYINLSMSVGAYMNVRCVRDVEGLQKFNYPD